MLSSNKTPIIKRRSCITTSNIKISSLGRAGESTSSYLPTPTSIWGANIPTPIANQMPLKLEDEKEENTSLLHLLLHGAQALRERTTVGLFCSKQITVSKPQHRLLRGITFKQEYMLLRGLRPAHQPSVTLSVLAQKLRNVLLWKCHLGFLTFEFLAELYFEIACLEEGTDKGDILFPAETDECNYLSRHTSFIYFSPFETLSPNMGNYKENQFAK